MRASLVRHDRLIEAIVGEHSGVVVRPRGEGDSRFVVFPRAIDSVIAASTLQKALHSEPWPTATPLRVRIALNTGEADLREGDYYGSAVNRCARLRGVAYGGQTLISAATQELVHDNLPQEVTLRDLGVHHLKDLQRPENIFELVTQGISSDFPPLQSLDTMPNNLPVQLTSFVGREREIEEIKGLLSSTRLLTLTGPGGTGKTRLALQTAADMLEAFPDGVWLVELAPVADPKLVPQAIASALGVREVSGTPLSETLIKHLSPKSTLLLLDNCEHVIDECARLVEALLRACPHLSVLATSREPLGIAGEYPYRVRSLSLPDGLNLSDPDTLAQFEAAELFVERARVAQPSFAFTTQNAAAVVEICRRLDGIPLAIELAAARVRVLSVDQIAARLDDRFRLLTGGSRTAMPRQQTLQAAMDWSYDLLSREERTLLRWLSVFMGGWNLEAAESLCAGEGIEAVDVLDLLTHLVDKSLVVVEQPELRPAQGPAGSEQVRYRYLETVRQYARDKLLEAGETERIRDKHLDYFVTVAESLEPRSFGPGSKAGLDRLQVEHDNLRAALEWSLGDARDVGRALRLAGALRYFWWIRGYHNEGRRWLERVLAMPGSATDEDDVILVARGKVLQGAAQLGWQQADNELARGWLEESVSLQRRIDDLRNLAQSLHILGHVTFDLLDFSGARAYFEESLSLFRRLADKSIAPSLVGDLGMVAYHVGDNVTARHYLEQCIAEYRELGPAEGGSMALTKLGDVARSQGDYGRAADLYQQGLEQAREIGARVLAANALHKLGQVARYHGDYAKALAHFKESLAMQREAGHKLGIVECLAGFAGVALAQGQLERATRLFGAADALLERIKLPLVPADRAQYDQDLAALGQRRQLAWEEGRAVTIDQAVTYALEGTANE
jgi:predicted ATPase